GREEFVQCFRIAVVIFVIGLDGADKDLPSSHTVRFAFISPRRVPIGGQQSGADEVDGRHKGDAHKTHNEYRQQRPLSHSRPLDYFFGVVLGSLGSYPGSFLIRGSFQSMMNGQSFGSGTGVPWVRARSMAFFRRSFLAHSILPPVPFHVFSAISSKTTGLS